ncbi:MAG: uncharacterized protein QOD98_384 [Nocardioidaceae bacterium]|nr:uncharacterized protein [Nocardioidaceae bacterium]
MPGPAEPVSRSAPPLRGRVISTQAWRDLTFLHWAVDPAHVATLLPPGTSPDVHEDRTYVGLVPFRMVGVTVGRGRAVPYLGTFLETNVRLYSVDETGRRGVVFLSLDADRSLVVPTIRTLTGAPYRWARMRLRRDGDRVTYDARLRRLGQRPRTHVVVRVGAPRAATPLDDFLTARWGAHVRRRNRTTYVPNTHGPWPLRDAEVLELDDELVAAAGFPGLTDRAPDHVAFSDGVQAEFGSPYDARQPR